MEINMATNTTACKWFHLFHSRGPQTFQKASSHLRSLGARKV